MPVSINPPMVSSIRARTAGRLAASAQSFSGYERDPGWTRNTRSKCKSWRAAWSDLVIAGASAYLNSNPIRRHAQDGEQSRLQPGLIDDYPTGQRLQRGHGLGESVDILRGFEVEILPLVAGPELAGERCLAALARPLQEHHRVRAEPAFNPRQQFRTFDQGHDPCILSGTCTICRDFRLCGACESESSLRAR
jgi:hypothetical protein